MAREVEKAMIGPVKRAKLKYRTYSLQEMQEKDRVFERLQAEHDAVVESGRLAPGFLWASPVADGRAIYRVETLRPLTLQHVPIGDAWRVPAAHLRGLTLRDIEQAFRNERFWMKMRGGAQQETT